MKKPKLSVAQYIEQLVAMSPKSQKEIAEEIGYDKPNMITMIKQGKTKLPVNKVGPLAKSLGIDPMHLLRLTLDEYMPDTLDAIEAIMGQSLVTQEELGLVHTVREATGGVELDFSDEKLQHAVIDAIRPFANAENEARDRAVEATRRASKAA